MELTPVTYLIVLPLVFLAGFVDSVAGGGGIISLPAYLMAGIPAHLAAGTNKVVNGTGTLVAALKYFRSGKVLLRPAVTAAVCALIGSAVGTELAALISEQTLETLMLVALPCVAVFLSVKKDFGRDIPAEERPVYTPRQELLRSALIGLVFGCYDGLVGPGTGTFMILGFTALLSLDLITAGGCAKASNLASCAASAVVWILHGQVLWALAIPALACSIAGNYLGALYAIRGGSKKIRSVMFLVLGLLAAVLAAVVHLLYHTEYAETSTPNDCFAAVSATATGETAVPKIVCLTFDDGPSAHTPEILDILEKEHVPATFFVCAQDANEAHLDKIADIAAAGHQIALHSASHQYSKIYRSTDAFWQDIKQLRQAISPYVDADSLTWLRFPGGSTNTVSHKYGGSGIMKRLKAQAEERGLHWIDWNVCAEDAAASHPNAAQILRNVQNDAKDQPICVVLMHDTNATHETVKALPDILEWFAAKGYRFFTVQQMAE